jgi:hypothetical protein
MISYLAERPKRFTTEEKVMRVQNTIACTDETILQKIGPYISKIYDEIPNTPNKDASFIEAVQYLVLNVLLERMNRIFTDETDARSPTLQKLGSEMRRNIDIIKEIWTANNFERGIQYLDSILSTSLKGARRKC